MSAAPYRMVGMEEAHGWSSIVSLPEPDGGSNVCLTASKKAIRVIFTASTMHVTVEFAESLDSVMENGSFQSSEYLLTLSNNAHVSTITSLIDGQLYLAVTYASTDNKIIYKDLYVDVTGEGHNFTYRARIFSYDATGWGTIYDNIPGAAVMRLSNGILFVPACYWYWSIFSPYDYAKSYACSSTDNGYTWTQYSRFSGGYWSSASSCPGNAIELDDGTVLWRAFDSSDFYYVNKDTPTSGMEQAGDGSFLDALYTSPITLVRFGLEYFMYISKIDTVGGGGAIFRYDSDPIAGDDLTRLFTESNWTYEVAAEEFGQCVLLSLGSVLIVSSGKTVMTYTGRVLPERIKNMKYKDGEDFKRVRKASYKKPAGSWSRITL